MSDLTAIAVWWCDECGYWRQEQSTGVHQTTNADDPRGKMVSHELRLREFYAADEVVEAGAA